MVIMHTADGQDYYDDMLRSCTPKTELLDRISFLEGVVKELEKENADLRWRCGIKKRVYNGHLGTMCEE